MKQKHTKYTNTNESMHSEMGQEWQNPCLCLHSFSTQYNTEQFW